MFHHFQYEHQGNNADSKQRDRQIETQNEIDRQIDIKYLSFYNTNMNIKETMLILNREIDRQRHRMRQIDRQILNIFLSTIPI